MLADSVEAASRTLGRSSSEQVEILVSKIIEDKRSDGQLDESELTFKDLQQIQISFLRSLCALRHDRVPYSEKQGIENDIAYPSNHHLSELTEPSSRQQYSDGA
jgi:membrane-associated HD superfamily phosphohydrolase